MKLEAAEQESITMTVALPRRGGGAMKKPRMNGQRRRDRGKKAGESCAGSMVGTPEAADVEQV
jgi:hypothetical protein